MRDFVNEYLDPSKRTTIADVGAYDVNGTYRGYFDSHMWEYTGFDIAEGPNVDVVLSPSEKWDTFKRKGSDGVYVYDDASKYRDAYDVVVTGQTLEHVPAAWLFFVDLTSLMRPGGLLWVTAPNTEIFHEHPVDCWRIWPAAMRRLGQWAGLEEIRVFARGPDTTGIFRKPG